MKKMLFLVFGVAILSGCIYSESDMEESMTACAQRQGVFQVGVEQNSHITSTYCVIDGYRYMYSRDTASFVNASLP